VSRAQLQRFIGSGDVKVNKTVQTKFGFMVKQTDKVTLARSAFDTPTIPKIDIAIIYEDDQVIVIDKPVGLLSHSKGAFNPEATVATWLASKLGIGPSDREGIVHRLDRGTSGVMIVAKNDETRQWLQKQFSQRKVKKAYIARIDGTLKHPEANIDLPIERNPKSPQRFRVGQNGKTAQTYYKVLKTLDNGDSIVELRPLTGRTHQLRVHLKYMGHPIIGDTFYDGREADRLYLHAHSLELTLPNKTRQTFTSAVPKAFYKKEV
jgi:23S rRNA pseudouridine1911/1915/1917 synthase